MHEVLGIKFNVIGVYTVTSYLHAGVNLCQITGNCGESEVNVPIAFLIFTPA